MNVPETNADAFFHLNYALRVLSNSGGNRIREGDIVSVLSSAEPVVGEDVVVMLNSGEHMVKELVSIRPDSITLADTGDERLRVIDRHDVQYIHPVIGIHPRRHIAAALLRSGTVGAISGSPASGKVGND